MPELSSKKMLPANHDVVIMGRRVIIKPISEKEIDERYLSWLNDPKLNEFLEVRHKKQTLGDVVNYINTLRSKKSCELFAIFTEKGNLHIGNIAITRFNSNKQGYAIYGLMIGDARAQALGLGGDASVLVIEYLFGQPEIRRIQVSIIADNHNALSVVELLGFKKEGTLRQHSVLSSGRVSDVHIYGMLRQEWAASRKNLAVLLKGMQILKNGWTVRL